MIDKDLLEFYNKVLGSKVEKKIIEMLEGGIDNEEILEYILTEDRGEEDD